MPLLVIPLVLILLLMFMAVMLPLSTAMRFRASSTRRRARSWVVSVNLFAALLSVMILLVTAAVSNMWVPNAFRYVLIGLTAGLLLGLFGLAASRWETTPQSLHYTPNRGLILLITLVVSARIFYSFWRAWHAWQTTADEASWIAASGAAGSMGAGAAVLAYYVAYWAGLRRKVRRHESLTRSR